MNSALLTFFEKHFMQLKIQGIPLLTFAVYGQNGAGTIIVGKLQKH